MLGETIAEQAWEPASFAELGEKQQRAMIAITEGGPDVVESSEV